MQHVILKLFGSFACDFSWTVFLCQPFHCEFSLTHKLLSHFFAINRRKKQIVLPQTCCADAAAHTHHVMFL